MTAAYVSGDEMLLCMFMYILTFIQCGLVGLSECVNLRIVWFADLRLSESVKYGATHSHCMATWLLSPVTLACLRRQGCSLWTVPHICTELHNEALPDHCLLFECVFLSTVKVVTCQTGCMGGWVAVNASQLLLQRSSELQRYCCQ